MGQGKITISKQKRERYTTQTKVGEVLAPKKFFEERKSHDKKVLITNNLSLDLSSYLQAHDIDEILFIITDLFVRL